MEPVSNAERDTNSEVHYQLYKLLAFAIQELNWFANEERVAATLTLPSPERILTNRAQMAVDRIEKQNPHFFSGYITYRRGVIYPKEIGVGEERT